MNWKLLDLILFLKVVIVSIGKLQTNISAPILFQHTWAYYV